MTTIAWAECRNGHALTERASYYITPDGFRRCRVCKRQSDRRTRLKRSQGRPNYPNKVPVRADKYRDWAMTAWQQMSDRDRRVVGFALGYLTLEQAVA
jgi:hypothetical protein